MALTAAIDHAFEMRLLAYPALFAVLTGCIYVPTNESPRRGQAWRASAGSVRPPDWTSIGMSVEGRPIRYRTVGTGLRQVLWIGGIHGNEVAGTVATRELVPTVLTSRTLRQQVTLHMVKDMNPDGRAANRRTNSRGVDLNRDFPASNRRNGGGLSQPESRAIHDLIRRIRPDLIIVAHSWGGRYFINYDGPALAYAQRFSQLSQFPLVPSSDINATPGSMGSWCGIDMSIPILTLEWEKGTPPDDAWATTRSAILAVIAGDV